MIKVFFLIILTPSFFILPYAWYGLCYTLVFALLILSTIHYSFLTGPSYTSTFLFVDRLSWPLIMLSIWIFILSILASQNLITSNQQPRSFLFFSLILLGALLICFSRRNLLIFYFFFETSLIPTLLLIIIWGYQPERLQAGTYLILYTISASLPLLLRILLLIKQNGHLNINLLFLNLPIEPSLIYLWSLQLSAAFLVKLPLYSTHLWLPKAHVEAPVAGSIILAGILLKLGVYGLLRIASLFPQITISLNFIILPVRILGASITRFICLRQTDFKSLIAYSSVGHIGLLAGGLFSGFYWGWEGALLISVAHGLCSSALFALANILYLTTSTRSLFLIKGLQTYFPIITLWWFLFSISNIAAPPTPNLLSEIILITSILASRYIIIIPLALLRFLRAAYSLFLFVSLHHGLPSQQINPLLLLSPNNYTTLILHLIPLITIILAPNITTSWLF